VLLVFCTADHGGIADYAHAQCEAVVQLGYPVLLLAPSSFPFQSSLYKHQPLPCLKPKSPAGRLHQQLATALTILRQQIALNRALATTGARQVLFTTYSEYLAPLWAWRLRRLQRKGVRFAAVVHDPVRDFVVGPRCWHRLSIAQGYSFLNLAFVHAPIQLDTSSPQPQLRTQVIPHGPYRYPAAMSSAAELRRRLAIPPQTTLLLSFGHIRDNKNLQLILQAMAELPELWLLVAGPEATAGQRPSAHYRQLAEQFGVANRCRWQIGYQSPEQVADHFVACDGVLLTYSGQFHSASGVLHLAAHYCKPMIASAGAGALLDTVRSFDLGVVVQADDATALAHGIQHWLSHPPAPDWPGYESANSWERNAELVAQALGLEPDPLPRPR
jgi:glycosyltransferase involved in cell wall biosynthesis